MSWRGARLLFPVNIYMHAPFFSASAFCHVIIETPAAVNTFAVVVIDVHLICSLFDHFRAPLVASRCSEKSHKSGIC